MPPTLTSRRSLLLAPAVLAAAGVPVTGCTRTPDPGPVRIEPQAPISLAVGSMEVQDQVQTLPLNFIDRRRSEEMVATTRDYLTRGLQAVGGTDFGKAVIEEASIVEEVHPRGGVTGAVAGPERELRGILAVRVAVTDGLGVEKSYARARVELKRPVGATSSVVERDRQARELTNDLLRSLSTALQSAIRENLGPYLVTS